MIPFQFPWFTPRGHGQENYSDACSCNCYSLQGADSPKASLAARIAALEIALGLWGRAFASAKVTPDSIVRCSHAVRSGDDRAGTYPSR